MKPLWGARGNIARVAALVLSLVVPLALATATEPPPAVAADHHAGGGADVDGDMVVPRLPDRPADAPPPARRATNGWTPLDPRYRFKAHPTYRLRLIAGAEQARDLAETVVLLDPYVDMTVMPGTVSRTNPRRGEVLVSISDTSPCSSQRSDWLGCGGPKKVSWVKGTHYNKVWIGAGRVWLRPSLFTSFTRADQVHVLLHELGHVLGLGHHDATYQGSLQVMQTSFSSPLPTYQAGDRNGLRSARGLEKGWRNFRVGAVAAARFKGDTVLVGADAEGKVWARMPAGHGYDWKSIGGVLRGTPAITVRDGRMSVYGVGTDGALYRDVRQSGKWSGWARVAATNWAGGVSAVVDAAGRVHVYGRSAADGSAQQETETTSGWVLDNLGGVLIGDIGSMYLSSSGAFSIWGVGTNHLLYQQNYIPGSGWGGWAVVGGSPATLDGGVTAIRDNTGRYRLAVVNEYGSIQHASWTSATGWKWWVRKTSARGRVGMLPIPRSGRIQEFVPSLEGHVRASTQTHHGWTGFRAVKPR